VAVHTEDHGWIYANTSGSVDLLTLQNLSVVLAQVSVPANDTVNEVRLYVANASIAVNGTKYSLMLPSGILKIPVNQRLPRRAGRAGGPAASRGGGICWR